MLSYKEGGVKIAKIKGGKFDNHFIYLHPEKNNDDFDIKDLSKEFFRKHRKIKKSDALKLKQALIDRNPPENTELLNIYTDAINDLKKQDRNDIRIQTGVIQPLPKKNIIEKIYVSAPSGAGKSTFCGNWMAEYKKMFKDDDIFIFSTINNDYVLDKHNPIRVELTEDLIENPISPDEIENSVCVFDDVDTITNVKIRKNITGLRDWLLEQGRHFNIRMLMTSHLLMNYQSTRRLLNESTAVVFFPKSGSTYQIKRFLKMYIGLDNTQIKRILNLPSRWVAIYKTYPIYVMYEKGIYLLTNDE